MPIDFSGLPNKAPGTPGGLDLTGLPDKAPTPQPQAAQEAKPAQPEPGFFEKIGGWRGLGGMGIRALSGILGVEGGPIGAGISGLGETGAEMLEKGTWDPREVDPARVAVATGTGLIPFGKVVQGGRVASSALRSGALSGGGELAREYLSGEKFDPKAVGLTTGIGAVAGAGGSKLATMLGAGEKLPGTVEKPSVTPQRQMGTLRRQVNTEGIPVRDAVKAEEILPTGAREFDLGPIETPKIAVEPRSPAGIGPGVSYPGSPTGPKPYRSAAKAAAKADEAALGQQNIADEIAERGLVQGTPRVSENAVGKRSMTTPWVAPPEEEQAVADITKRQFTPQEYEKFNAPAPFEDIFGPEGPKPAFDWPEVGGRSVPNAQGSHITIPSTPEQPEPALAKLFKSRAGAAGENYGTAKAAEKAGEIGSADEAYNAFARERAALGQETAPRTPIDMGEFQSNRRNARIDELLKKIGNNVGTAADEAEVDRLIKEGEAPFSKAMDDILAADRTPTPAPERDWIQQQTDLADAAGQEPALRDRLLKLAQEEKGSVDPQIQRLLSAATGAAIGAPIGSAAEGDEGQYGALKGALAGGLIGYNVGQGANALVNARNSMLLAAPNPVSKNVIGDMGGMLGETLKQAITPGQQEYAKDLFRNLPFVSPGQYGRDYWHGLTHANPSGPRSSMQDIVGEALNKPMEMIYRPFNASNYAITQAMERAGAPQKTIEQAVGIATPETRTMQSWLGLQQHPLFRYLFPFQKIASNVLEGSRNIPGVSLIAGNPADKWQRTALGGLQTALGAGSELYDEANAAEGTPTSNWTKGVRAGALGPKFAAPYAAGYGLAAIANQGPAKALSELVNLIPGARAVLPAAYPNESADEYASRVLAGPLKQMIPTVLRPNSDTGSVR